MTRQDINLFEKIQAQLEGLHTEISALSKKSQNDALNKFKLKFVNEILKEANSFLGENYKPFSSFQQFDEDDMPTNSDVAMILTQYLYCFEKLRADNIVEHFGSWYWKVDGKKTSIQTGIPKKVSKK